MTTTGEPRPAGHNQDSWRAMVHLLIAVTAWIGVAASVLLSGLGAYGDEPSGVGLYGGRGPGIRGFVYRVVDSLSYFTTLSNLVVALTFTVIYRRRLHSATFLRKVLLHDSLLMITVTAIVYAVLLAPTTELTGWSVITNPWQHILVPTVTIIGWLTAGPRGWLSWSSVGASLGIPVLWICWMLLRGAIEGTYPYGFVNLATQPTASVMTTVAAILLFGVIVAIFYLLVDKLLTRFTLKNRTPN